MIELDNRTDHIVKTDSLQKIADDLTRLDIELIITDDQEIQVLNRDHRGIDAPTDVISFPFEPMPLSPLGSIVISIDHVKKGAKYFGHTQDDELTLLFIHGLLHLLGYDHETDHGEMRKKEHAIIMAYSLPESLIIRTLKET
jgi:probable rRNA maturation factor